MRDRLRSEVADLADSHQRAADAIKAGEMIRDSLVADLVALATEAERLRASLATIACAGCTPVANRTAPALCWSITDDQADWCPSCRASHALWAHLDQ